MPTLSYAQEFNSNHISKWAAVWDLGSSMNIVSVKDFRVVLRKKFHEVNNGGTVSENLLEAESLRSSGAATFCLS